MAPSAVEVFSAPGHGRKPDGQDAENLPEILPGVCYGKSRLIGGYVCVSEYHLGGTVIIWADGRFFRIESDSFKRLPKPLTPFFSDTEMVSHPRKIGKMRVPTYVARFNRFGSVKESFPYIVGTFSHGDRSVTFDFNPGGP